MKNGIILALSLLSFNLSAAVYKCTVNGVETYSQDPCAEDAQEITVTPPQKINNKPEFSEAELVQQCVVMLKHTAGFKDPESIKVGSHYYDWFDEGSGPRRVLRVHINGKNSYGAYSGGEYYNCYLNHSGTQLSDYQFYIAK